MDAAPNTLFLVFEENTFDSGLFYTFLPLYGCIGFFTPQGTVGIQGKYEILFLAAYHGFLLGATQWFFVCCKLGKTTTEVIRTLNDKDEIDFIRMDPILADAGMCQGSEI